MKGFFQKLLPKKSHFVGIDIGTCQIKVAEVKIIDGAPEVVALRQRLSPPGVWTEEFDEESLTQALKEVAGPELKEVITCIGGEKVISRLARLPRMSEKEQEAAIKFEIEKFVPLPVDQLIIKHVELEDPAGKVKKGRFLKAGGGDNREKPAETGGNREESQNVLLLAVPAATIYQYYGIFSRAGLVITAVDLQAFALWRLFGRTVQGTAAVVDIGAKTSHLLIVKDGLIKFIRLLPVGGDILTGYLSEAYGVDFSAAQQMKEEAAVAGDSATGDPAAGQISAVLNEGLPLIARELHRSLEFLSAHEKLSVEKLILSGGASKLRGFSGYLQNALGIPVETGTPAIGFAPGLTFDPAFSVALGLALREVNN